MKLLATLPLLTTLSTLLCPTAAKIYYQFTVSCADSLWSYITIWDDAIITPGNPHGGKTMTIDGDIAPGNTNEKYRYGRIDGYSIVLRKKGYYCYKAWEAEYRTPHGTHFFNIEEMSHKRDAENHEYKEGEAL
jgi:hypothetical protein